jgi:serine/threonine protein kinase
VRHVRVADIVNESIVSETDETTVWRGSWGTFAADIRYFKTAGRPWKTYDEFAAAMIDLTSLQHENLSLIYGGGVSPDATKFVVAERAEGTTLRAHLSTVKPRWTDWQTIAAGIADAMQYLHASGAAHRNLTSETVMIDGLGIPKLEDYGVGAFMFPVHSRTQLGDKVSAAEAALDNGARPPLWLAPEVLSLWNPAVAVPEAGSVDPADASLPPDGLSLIATRAADTYSFAIVLWSLVVNRVPWGEIPAETADELATLVARAVIRGRRPAIPPEYAKVPAAKMIRTCWAESPRDRPTFTAIAAAFAANRLDSIANTDSAPHSPTGSSTSSPPRLNTATLQHATLTPSTEIYE